MLEGLDVVSSNTAAVHHDESAMAHGTGTSSLLDLDTWPTSSQSLLSGLHPTSPNPTSCMHAVCMQPSSASLSLSRESLQLDLAGCRVPHVES